MPATSFRNVLLPDPFRPISASDSPDSMRIETPGGGGYGPPAQRALDQLARDLRDGRVSRAAALRDYGLERVAAALAFRA